MAQPVLQSPHGSRVVRARLDSSSELSLDLPMREGLNESKAVCTVFVEAGQCRRQRLALTAEVQRLAADEQDRGARARVMADMDAAGVDWPE